MITQSTQTSSLPFPRWSTDTGSQGASTFFLGAPGKADQIPNPQKHQSFCFLQQAAASQICSSFGAAAPDPSGGALLSPGHAQQLFSSFWYQQDKVPGKCCDTAQDRGSGISSFPHQGWSQGTCIQSQDYLGWKRPLRPSCPTFAHDTPIPVVKTEDYHEGLQERAAGIFILLLRMKDSLIQKGGRAASLCLEVFAWSPAKHHSFEDPALIPAFVSAQTEKKSFGFAKAGKTP